MSNKEKQFLFGIAMAILVLALLSFKSTRSVAVIFSIVPMTAIRSIFRRVGGTKKRVRKLKGFKRRK